MSVRDEVVELYRQGSTCRDVEAMPGVPSRQAVSLWSREAGVARPRSHRKRKAAEVNGENLPDVVGVEQTNEKLRHRTTGIVMDATGAGKDATGAGKDATDTGKGEAKERLGLANGNAKLAITMILASCGREEALERLERARGHAREAIGSRGEGEA